jgi:hypothetical protein
MLRRGEISMAARLDITVSDERNKEEICNLYCEIKPILKKLVIVAGPELKFIIEFLMTILDKICNCKEQ